MYRPLPCDPGEPGALRLAGGWVWFARVERLTRAGATVIPADDLPEAVRARLTAPRPGLAGLDMSRPNLMGVVNVTPDSFSDGGQFLDPGLAIGHARQLRLGGADILDIGGESTRPGAGAVTEADELARVLPVLTALAGSGPLSIDTRKSGVARAAVAAGAGLLNDVSALSFDPDSLATAAALRVPVCLMHHLGTPETMQADPKYDNVLLDIYEWLEARIDAAVAAGIARERLMIDPGIGFGKTLEHNLALMRGVGLFHALGLPILVGASRKRFIGTLTGTDQAARRGPGSVAAALAAVAQGVQMLRVHDVAETAQALRVWQAIRG